MDVATISSQKCIVNPEKNPILELTESWPFELVRNSVTSSQYRWRDSLSFMKPRKTLLKNNRTLLIKEKALVLWSFDFFLTYAVKCEQALMFIAFIFLFLFVFFFKLTVKCVLTQTRMLLYFLISVSSRHQMQSNHSFSLFVPLTIYIYIFCISIYLYV